MLVDAENGDLRGEQGFEVLQAGLSHIAETSVVRSPLSVIPVGDYDEVQAELFQQVQSLYPMQILSYFVYLINRQRKPAEGQGGRAGRDEASSALDSFQDDLWDGCPGPVFQGVGRTAGADEDIVRLPQSLIRFPGLVGRNIPGSFEGNLVDGLVQAFFKIFSSLIVKVVGIHLETCGGIDEDGLDRRGELFEEIPMNPNHGIGRFPGAHDGNHSLTAGHTLLV